MQYAFKYWLFNLLIQFKILHYEEFIMKKMKHEIIEEPLDK